MPDALLLRADQIASGGGEPQILDQDTFDRHRQEIADALLAERASFLRTIPPCIDEAAVGRNSISFFLRDTGEEIIVISGKKRQAVMRKLLHEAGTCDFAALRQIAFAHLPPRHADPTNIKTRAVAGAAYKQNDIRSTLTHAVDQTTEKPLCERVKPENILDDPYAVADEDAPATCPVCAKRDPRFNDPEALKEPSAPSLEGLIENTSARYPIAGKEVGGLTVRDHVPNLSSIDGYMAESETLPGVRVVPMSDLGSPRSVFYAADDFARSERLAGAIEESQEINPLIIGVDEKGPFIIEGAHRFVALYNLKVKEFPAIVVVGRE